MKKIITVLVLLIFKTTYSQGKYEFMGALKLAGNNNTLITYRVVFQESKGIIRGYSITDFGGEDETKSTISGTYSSKSKEVAFKEDAILYTKSTTKKQDFCFVHFKGKTKLSEKQNKMEGDFEGLYKNGSKCIDGKIVMVSSRKINKIIKKISPKLIKAQKNDTSLANKPKIDLTRILDDIKVNRLNKNQNLNLFVKSDKLTIEIWDAQEEDGDQITIFLGDKIVLNNYMAINKKKVINVNLDKNEDVLRLEAVSEGSIAPNTIMIKITNGENTYDLNLNLKKNDTATITLLKEV